MKTTEDFLSSLLTCFCFQEHLSLSSSSAPVPASYYDSSVSCSVCVVCRDCLLLKQAHSDKEFIAELNEEAAADALLSLSAKTLVLVRLVVLAMSQRVKSECYTTAGMKTI